MTDHVKRKRDELKRRARDKGMELDLSLAAVRALLAIPRCGYCGRAFGGRCQLSVERIDAAVGYVPGNVTAACVACNTRKGWGGDIRRARKRLRLVPA